jgi:eukaryotic-like serine/threonine-protein kinase
LRRVESSTVAPIAQHRPQLPTVSQDGRPRLSDSESTHVYDDAYLQALVSASEPQERTAEVTGVADPAAPWPGQMLAGKYRVERVLGTGGMGVVVAARHIQLDVPVALKFMTDEALADHALVTRFLREARATARLRGEHVIRVADVGELDSGAPYMVMEHLHGQDLAALLASLGPPPVSSAVEYVIQACEGLDEAHRAGIVHRDIKPSNLFLTRRPNGTPCIKLLDFGISKSVRMLHASELHSTSDHAVFGTPLYMAPEQMRAARDVDGRADLWSLGASLYELLSGTAPFPAESIVTLAYRIANEAPPPLCEKRPEIPGGLERIVFRCLERDRDRRFPDARSLAVALEPYRTHAGAAAFREPAEDEDMTVIDPPLVEPPAPLLPPDESLATSSVSWGRSKRPPAFAWRRRQAIVAASVVIGVGLGAAVGLTRREPAAVVRTTATTARAPRVASVTPSANVPEVVSLAPLPEPNPSEEPPTVSVMDLPSVPVRPAFVPVVASAASAPPAVAPKVDPDGILSVRPAPAASKGVVPRDAPTIHTDLANCSPPYYFDEVGLKIFKPECVN